MTFNQAKENLFKNKKLDYFEAVTTKIELIRNKDKLEIDVEKITIQNIGDDYYVKYEDLEEEYLIARAEKL